MFSYTAFVFTINQIPLIWLYCFWQGIKRITVVATRQDLFNVKQHVTLYQAFKLTLRIWGAVLAFLLFLWFCDPYSLFLRTELLHVCDTGAPLLFLVLFLPFGTLTIEFLVLFPVPRFTDHTLCIYSASPVLFRNGVTKQFSDLKCFLPCPTLWKRFAPHVACRESSQQKLVLS